MMRLSNLSASVRAAEARGTCWSHTGRAISGCQLRACREEDLGFEDEWGSNPGVGTCASRTVKSDGLVVLLVLVGLSI